MNEIINEKLFKSMTENRAVRLEIVKNSFVLFFFFYFAGYVKYATADFQKEIMVLLEDDKQEDLFVLSFRGSGKSTIVTTAYVLWSMLGKQQKKFPMIFCKTQDQAKAHMANIRSALESNDLLKNDFWEFKDGSGEWSSSTLDFLSLKTKLRVSSIEQAVRGFHNNEHRPDLIVCDDIEDIASTRTQENRDKTFNWLFGEAIQGGDLNTTRLIILGNALHEDSMLMKIEKKIEAGQMRGRFLRYPLLDEKGKIQWPGKYSTIEKIEQEKQRCINDIFWEREFQLKILPEDGYIIKREWIQRYKTLPSIYGTEYMGTFASVDLAISLKDTADKTAILLFMVFGTGDNLKIYILDYFINQRLDYLDQVEALNKIKRNFNLVTVYVEDVGYQKAFVQHLERAGFSVISVKPIGSKNVRLSMASMTVKLGKVFFPMSEDMEVPINQIVNFGSEKFDDIADSFSMGINSIVEEFGEERSEIAYWI